MKGGRKLGAVATGHIKYADGFVFDKGGFRKMKYPIIVCKAVYMHTNLNSNTSNSIQGNHVCITGLL